MALPMLAFGSLIASNTAAEEQGQWDSPALSSTFGTDIGSTIQGWSLFPPVIVSPPVTIQLPSLGGSWDPRFGLPPGVNGRVFCAVIFRGELYLGGLFTLAGTNSSKGIARWDGKNWKPVPEGGVDGYIYEMLAHGNSLYVAGRFRTMGETRATNIARLQSQRWQSLGDGIALASPTGQEQWVSAIAVRGRHVYIGGNFTQAGGAVATNVAKWDGDRWQALAGGIGRDIGVEKTFGQVEALTFVGRDLYAGGLFDRAGGTWATNLARWDGSAWHSVHSGVSGGNTRYQFVTDGIPYIHLGFVTTLARQGRNLLTGGDFTSAGTVAATNLASWNGRDWKSVGGGVQGNSVGHISVHGPEVFVAGAFERAGDKLAANVARWDGRRWQALGSGLRGFGSALAWHRGTLFAGGYFGLAGGTPSAFVAKWRRGEWSALHPKSSWPTPWTFTNAVIGEIRAIAVSGQNIYVGGSIFSAGLVPVNQIACWNGTQWSALGEGVCNGTIEQIAVQGTNVWVSGYFRLEDVGATNLAWWNGVRWAAVDGPARNTQMRVGPVFSGTPGAVIAASSNLLFVAGEFTLPDAQSFHGIGSWDGERWKLLVSASAGSLASSSPDAIRLLAAGGGKLFASGLFTSIGGTIATNVAQWDGTNWLALGNGLPIDPANYATYPRAMAFAGSQLFVAGKELTADVPPSPTNLLFLHEERLWAPRGISVEDGGELLALGATTNFLYAAGAFTRVDGASARNIVRSFGGWIPVGDGVGSAMSSEIAPREYIGVIATGDPLVCVGGRFGEIDGFPAFNFAVWGENTLFALPLSPSSPER